jgi:hypothetical protein
MERVDRDDTQQPAAENPAEPRRLVPSVIPMPGIAGMTRSMRMGSLLVLAVLLAAAVMLLPWPTSSWWTGTPWTGPHGLAEAVRLGLVRDWTDGVLVPGEGGSALADPTRFWRWFHVVKAVLAGGVLVASGALVAGAWRARRAAETRGRRFGLLMLSAAGAAMVATSLVLVIANVQGAIAPLSSVLSFLPMGGTDPALQETVEELRGSLAGTGTSAAADVIAQDFSTYHWVVAALAAATTLVALVLAVRLLRRRERLAGVLLLVVALGFAVLAAANVSTALDPVPALDSFLRGAAG